MIKTKAEFEKVPAILESTKKLRTRKKEQNIKIQYLSFMESQIFKFLAERNNGYISERS